MELRQLEYLVAIIEEGGFARAAQQLHIAQSAVSQQIGRLERELGITVFDRRRRQVRLTPAGQTFIPHARAVLAAVVAARATAHSLAAGTDGVLRVGTSEGLGERLEAILASLTERRPEVDIRLVAAHTHDKLEAVRIGELEAAFVRAPRDTVGLVVLHLWNAELVVALPATHPAAAHARVPLSELADLPAALSPPDLAAGVAEVINQACARAGFRPLDGPSFTNVENLLAGPIATGKCWTLLYTDVAAHAPTRRVAFRPTEPRITIPTALITRPTPPPLVVELLHAVREQQPLWDAQSK